MSDDAVKSFRLFYQIKLFVMNMTIKGNGQMQKGPVWSLWVTTYQRDNKCVIVKVLMLSQWSQ